MARAGCHHPDVFAIRADQADFRRADAVVDAGAGFALRRGIVWSAGYGCRPCVVDFAARKIGAWRAAFNPAGRARSRFPQFPAIFAGCSCGTLFIAGSNCHMAASGRKARVMGEYDMNRTVIIGAIVVLLAAGGYCQFSYMPAQDAEAAAAACRREGRSRREGCRGSCCARPPKRSRCRGCAEGR